MAVFLTQAESALALYAADGKHPCHLVSPQVALGSAAGYAVSLSSVFLWDTCGPDALLRALGGSLTLIDGSPVR